MPKEKFIPIYFDDITETIRNIKYSKKFFVFFGSADSLAKKFYHLHEVAIFDRFNFNSDSPVTFYHNTDKACKS